MSVRKATESRLGVDFQDVAVLNLMISTDHASRAPVHTTDEACFQIRMHPPGHRLGGDA